MYFFSIFLLYYISIFRFSKKKKKMKIKKTKIIKLLPNEIWFEILLFLDLKNIYSCMLTNKLFYIIMSNDNFWKFVFETNFPYSYSYSKQGSLWKEKLIKFCSSLKKYIHLSHTYSILAEEFVNIYLNFLREKKNFGHLSNGYGASFLKLRKFGNDNIFMHILSKNCLIQKYTHNSNTGRIIILNPNKSKIILCCMSSSYDHKRSHYLYLRETNDEVRKHFKELIKKIKENEEEK